MLAIVQVTEHNDSVITATGQSAPIGAHLERVPRSLMCLSHAHTLSTLDLPPAQPAVTTSTDQNLSTRTPGQCRGHPGMLRQGLHMLHAARLPHEELAALSATTGGQPPPIGAPGHAPDSSIVSRQPQQLRTIGGVPHKYIAIIAPADQPRPIGAPGHTTDVGRLRPPNPAARACG